mmetsp:Transcript_89846/g.192683  ORF Transcript_89846/g.192683 Transcript_89846/m.192683 type:complete len:370 (-) Transcript_89846:247-1356(-)
MQQHVYALDDFVEVAASSGQMRRQAPQARVASPARCSAKERSNRSASSLNASPSRGALLQQEVALRREGAHHLIARLAATQDLHRSTHGRDLSQAHRLTILPLLSPLLHRVLSLFYVLLIVGDLQAQGLDLGRGLLPAQAPSAALGLHLLQCRLALGVLEALGLHELFKQALGICLLGSRLFKALGQRTPQLHKRLLDPQGSRLVAHLEGGLPIQLLPAPGRRLAGEESPQENSIAGAEASPCQLRRRGESVGSAHRRLRAARGLHSRLKSGSRRPALTAEEPPLLLCQHRRRRTSRGLLEDQDRLVERLNPSLHLRLCAQKFVALPLAQGFRRLGVLEERGDLGLEVGPLGGELDPACVDVLHINLQR